MAYRHGVTPTLTETLSFSLKALLCISIAVCGFMGVRSLLLKEGTDNWLQSALHMLSEELWGEDDSPEGGNLPSESASLPNLPVSSAPQ